MPDPVNLGFAMQLAPEKAIEYFQAKGFEISFRWTDVFKEQHKRAFTAAGAMKMDILQELRGGLDDALENGTTFRTFLNDLQPTLKQLGWWGRTEIVDPKTGEIREIDVNPYRLRNIYRTNLQTSYMTGRYKEQEARKDRRPFWMYVAIIDESTRPTHAEMNESVYPADDSIWDWMYPPNGWGCRCRVRSLSERRVKALGLEVHTGEGVKNFTSKDWDYNPGKDPYEPDLSKYDKDIADQYREAQENYTPPDLPEEDS